MEQSKFYQIKNVTEHEYTLVGCDGSVIIRPIQDIDKTASVFTIQDAKEGDVLAEEPIEGYPSSFVTIYKKQNGEDFDSYCFVGFDGKFNKGENGHSTEEIHPATKEQRDLLFQNMKESGYEWDDEKKELKKIEQKYTVKPIFSIGDVLCDKSCTTIDKNSQPNIEVRDIRNDMYICNNCSFPISQQNEYELVAKRIEPQSAWSDEDEEMLRSCTGAIWAADYYLYEDKQEMEAWLKRIKDRIGG